MQNESKRSYLEAYLYRLADFNVEGDDNNAVDPLRKAVERQQLIMSDVDDFVDAEGALPRRSHGRTLIMAGIVISVVIDGLQFEAFVVHGRSNAVRF